LEVTAESLITGSHTEGTLLEVFEHFAPFTSKNEHFTKTGSGQT
jgi:hypothetical protein